MLDSSQGYKNYSTEPQDHPMGIYKSPRTIRLDDPHSENRHQSYLNPGVDPSLNLKCSTF